MQSAKWCLVGFIAFLACTYDASRLRAPARDAAMGGSGGSGGSDAAADGAPDTNLGESDAPVEAEPLGVLDAPSMLDGVDVPATEAPGASVDWGEIVVDAPEEVVDAPASEAAKPPVDVETEAAGTVEAGGIVATGGTVGFGGTQGTGGAGGTGGKGGTGGTTTTVPATAVTFLNGMAQGPMTGYGTVSLGVKDSLTSPTCGGAQIKGLTPSTPALTFTSSCAAADTTWDATTALCMDGNVPAWPRNPTQTDYDYNWGVMIGVNAREPAQGIGVSYRTVTFTLAGQPTSGIRAVVHLRSDADNFTYCADMTPGIPIAFTSFNTQCWDNSGTNLQSADVVKIDLIGAHVPSGDTAIPVQNLCLTRIDLGK